MFSRSTTILSLALAATAIAAAQAFVVVPSSTPFVHSDSNKNGFAPAASRIEEDVDGGVSLASTEQQQQQQAAAAPEPTEEPANPRLSGLAFALDDGTRKSHSMAENTAFVQGFFKGISSPDSYRNLVTSLYYVYAAMEEGVLDNAAKDSTIGRIDEPRLRRLSGLEKDMEYFYGSDWKTAMTPPTPATKKYVDRILEIAGNDDDDDESRRYLFVAHQYTRYLGDLFGGQMMGSMATRSMNLPGDGSGVAFYEFEGVDSVRDFITDWYTQLNALDLTEQQQRDIVDEANHVFALNIGILEEVEGSPWAAVWTMAMSRVKDFTTWSNIKESKNNGNY
mmetsp:Transcript_1846/g.4037  ORF Transcript_1846/g.4037 Transcript_1846/m.4037 type:complete len:336 (-) Transcript_1846:250-1257(-)|eukprot:CAMPEP_0168179320 /NCGR_PEP_ID=MMETSP0139_2-20121125/9764_1 /TAXON_ID=44445 /ORGANISM="Pseudo-nitzschia australis, Strain 10249 10 AB" /LENGTH=335 /DNA_ID=CAMNT_0008099109 /DNA_START=136 /DNA_END=1143 /DNA_ORIENTATION=+